MEKHTKGIKTCRFINSRRKAHLQDMSQGTVEMSRTEIRFKAL